MHNESRREPKLAAEPEPVVEKSTEPSKLDRLKSATVKAGIAAIPTAMSVGLLVVGYKTATMNLDAAKIQLEAAKLAEAAQQVAQKA